MPNIFEQIKFAEFDRRYSQPHGEYGHTGPGNVLLSKNIALSMDCSKTGCNLNTLLVGSEENVLTGYVGPNIMQQNSSYVILDPLGMSYGKYGAFLKGNGYDVKVLNLIDIKKGDHYNPFRCFYTYSDAEAFVSLILGNSGCLEDEEYGEKIVVTGETDHEDGDGSMGSSPQTPSPEDIDIRRALLNAVFAYVSIYAKDENRSISTVIKILETAKLYKIMKEPSLAAALAERKAIETRDTQLVSDLYKAISSYYLAFMGRNERRLKKYRKDGFDPVCPFSIYFKTLKESYPESFAIRQYELFRKLAGNKANEHILACADMLQALFSPKVEGHTMQDDLDLSAVGDKKTAVFVITPDTGKACCPLAAAVCQQVIRSSLYRRNINPLNIWYVRDGEGNVIKGFRSIYDEDRMVIRAEAENFLIRARNGTLQFNEKEGQYELVTEKGEVVLHRKAREDAEKACALLQEGSVGHGVDGGRLPVHTRIMFCGTHVGCWIPNLHYDSKLIEFHDVSFAMSARDINSLRRAYGNETDYITANCDVVILYGGGTDADTARWCAGLYSKKATRRVILAPPVKYPLISRHGTLPAFMHAPAGRCAVFIRLLYAFWDENYDEASHPAWPLVQSGGPAEKDTEKE